MPTISNRENYIMRDYDEWLRSPIEFPEWYDELPPLHNHICLLSSSRLVRFLGFAEAFDDYYYIVKPIGFGQEKFYSSCVGHLESLKEQLKPQTYHRMEDIFNLNGCRPTDKFQIKKLQGNVFE